MATQIVYAALDGFTYQNAKIGNSNGTVAGTAPAINMDAQYTDPRLNSFVNNAGTAKVSLCNRNGSPGTVGAGTHWILNAPVASPLPSPEGNLSIIANPYATVPFGDLLYICEFDSASIQAADMTDNYKIVSFDGEPAYTFERPGYVNCGVDLELVNEGTAAAPHYVFYALYSSGQTFGGPWTYSTVVRLEVDEEGDPRGMLLDTAQAEVGRNATSMTQVQYTPTGGSLKTFLLISAIGGVQNAGSGNGVNSVISVVETGESMYKVADPVVGTYADGGISLDFKAITATPTDANDAFVYIMAASYNTSWATNWTVRETSASVIIEKAIEIKNSLGTPNPVPPINIGGFTRITYGTGTPGYFWTVVFSPSGSGKAGELIVGRGHATGDQLEVFAVTASGASTTPTTINSATLYGAAGCVLNTMTLVPASTSTVSKTFRAAAPPAVASGFSSMADFAAELRKKEGK